MATRRRTRTRKPRRTEVVSPAEAARRTRFILGAPPAPAPDVLETLVRERTSERLSGSTLAEALQGKPDGFFLETHDLDLFVAKAIVRALLPFARTGLGHDDKIVRARCATWIEKAEDLIR